MEWHERRRLLIVAGRGDQGGGVGVGVWRYGGGDDDEFLVPIAFTASRGGGPVGGGVGGGGGASGLVGYLLGVPPPSCAVAFRCDDDDDDAADVEDARRAHVAVVDPEGALHVWRADAARLAGASSAAAAAMTLEPVALAASAADSGCCSIAWWSRDALAIARVDGDVTVSTLRLPRERDRVVPDDAHRERHQADLRAERCAANPEPFLFKTLARFTPRLAASSLRRRRTAD